MISSQRSQVRQFLTKVIDEVLRRKGLEDSLAEFHAQAKKEAAKLQGIIANEVSVLTKKPEHEYERSLKNSCDMVRRTSYCKSREWDLRVMEIEKARVEREKGLEKAREVLGEMTVLWNGFLYRKYAMPPIILGTSLRIAGSEAPAFGIGWVNRVVSEWDRHGSGQPSPKRYCLCDWLWGAYGPVSTKTAREILTALALCASR